MTYSSVTAGKPSTLRASLEVYNAIAAGVPTASWSESKKPACRALFQSRPRAEL